MLSTRILLNKRCLNLRIVLRANSSIYFIMFTSYLGFRFTSKLIVVVVRSNSLFTSLYYFPSGCVFVELLVSSSVPCLWTIVDVLRFIRWVHFVRAEAHSDVPSRSEAFQSRRVHGLAINVMLVCNCP